MPHELDWFIGDFLGPRQRLLAFFAVVRDGVFHEPQPALTA
ncbi:hypothetical protein ACIPPM_21385 [Streptomyces sp. NPDC090119]